MKPTNRAGDDEISSICLKELAPVIAKFKPLSILFRRSYLEGEIQNSWRYTIIVPIFKKSS